MASPSRPLRPISSLLAEWHGARGLSPPVSVPLREAVGLVLAEDLRAGEAVPPRAIALRPGYAVASRDLVGASPYSPLLTAPPPRVEAGDDLPPGTDAVLPADAVAPAGRFAEIGAEVTPGESVRRAGEDLMAGQVLRRSGQVLRPLDAASALVAGLSHASARPFSLALLGPPEAQALLEVLVPIPHGMRVSVGAVPDGARPGPIPGADLTLVAAPSGSPLLRLAEGQGLALRGADTVEAGLWAGTPILLAPPRLDTLLALILGVVEPFAALATGGEGRRVWRRAPLVRKIASPVGLTDLVPLRETKGGLEPSGGGSITLAALSEAGGFLVVPPEGEGWPEGAVVEAWEL